MSELVVIGYPPEDAAGEVLETLERLQAEHRSSHGGEGPPDVAQQRGRRAVSGSARDQRTR